MLNREELAWAAGFFDGEGSIGCYATGPKRKSGYTLPTVRMEVGQTDPRPLIRFSEALGVGKVNGPYELKNPEGRPWKPRWAWNVSGKDNVQLAVWLLWAFLSEPKREQIDRVLSKYDWVRNGKE